MIKAIGRQNMRNLHPVKSGTLALMLFLTVLLIPSCGGGTSVVPNVDQIIDLKGANWQSYVGKTVLVEGIFVMDPVPMIVTDLNEIFMNKQLPFEQYLLLTGDEVQKLSADELGGAKIRVEGTVTALSGDLYPGEKVSVRFKKYQLLEKFYTYRPEIIDFDILDLLGNQHRYAVLFSGGINSSYNYVRYWNDLKFMYSTLINKCDFPAGHITVLYANGTGRDTDMPVDYSATQANLETVFNLLEEVSGESDTIFFFATNHGGGFYSSKANPHIYGGARDTNGDEGSEGLSETTYGIDFDGDGNTNDFVSWDEELFSWGGGIIDDTFNTLISENLVYDNMVIVMEQCFSAGLILDMAQSGGNRIIMAAAGTLEPSWAMAPDYNYDEFSYYFTCALNWADPDGTAVDADTDNDNVVSMVEAFNYARTNDSASETPHYEDSGDGVAHTGAMPSGGEGTLGGTVVFD